VFLYSASLRLPSFFFRRVPHGNPGDGHDSLPVRFIGSIRRDLCYLLDPVYSWPCLSASTAAPTEERYQHPRAKTVLQRHAGSLSVSFQLALTRRAKHAPDTRRFLPDGR